MSNIKFAGIIALSIFAVVVVVHRMKEVHDMTYKYRWADKRGQYCVAVDKDNNKLPCSSVTGTNWKLTTIDAQEAAELGLK